MEFYNIFWRCPNCKVINSDSWPKGQTWRSCTQPIVCSYCGVDSKAKDTNGDNLFWGVDVSARKKDLEPNDD